MHIVRYPFGAALMLVVFSAFGFDYVKNFSPDVGVEANVEIKGGDLLWGVNYFGGSAQGHITLDVDRPVHIAIGDYDFSGRRGFLVWYIDEGMGVHKIYRVFTFSPMRRGFVERFSACGDEFIDLRVEKEGRRLISSYYDEGVPKICITRLSSSR
ncbi:hypothetical protein ACV229_10770 [Burkholderia sp. MR1-5-21]